MEEICAFLHSKQFGHFLAFTLANRLIMSGECFSMRAFDIFYLFFSVSVARSTPYVHIIFPCDMQISTRERLF